MFSVLTHEYLFRQAHQEFGIQAGGGAHSVHHQKKMKQLELDNVLVRQSELQPETLASPSGLIFLFLVFIISLLVILLMWAWLLALAFA